MTTLSACNPIPAALYFLTVGGITMFSMNPLLLLLSLCGALSTRWLSHVERRNPLLVLLLFVATALINPLVSHNGATVLLVVRNNPITLEAALYGLCAAVMLCAVLIWCASFSALMTGDKLLYLFGRLSPKLALLLSMAMRYVPLLRAQTTRIAQAQRALGVYRDETILARCRGTLRVCSVLITWVLETGIITADSMEARGYGTGHRTQAACYRMTRRDAILLGGILLLSGISAVCLPAVRISFYPRLSGLPLTPAARLDYGAFALLAALPAILEGRERHRWNCSAPNT